MRDEGGRKVVVGRLPSDITEAEIRYVFDTYGRVLGVEHLEPEARGGFGTAFVVYDTKQAAEAAVKVLHEIYRFREDSKEPITVARAKAAYGRDRSRGKRGSSRTYHPGPDRRPERACDDHRGSTDRGVNGFVGERRSFGEGMGAERGGERGGGYDFGSAEQGRHNRSCHERTLSHDYPGGPFDNAGHDRRDRRDDSAERTRERSRRQRCGSDGRRGGEKGFRRTDGAPGNKLYVANLPKDITKDAIDYVFSNYGRVHDIHIMTGRSKSGMAAAFIIYSRADQAKRCILAMQQGYEIRPGQGNIVVKYADDQREPTMGGRFSRPQ